MRVVTESTQAYRINADGLPGLQLVSGGETQLAPTEARWAAARPRVPHEALTQAGAGVHEIHFSVERVLTGGGARRRARQDCLGGRFTHDSCHGCWLNDD